MFSRRDHDWTDRVRRIPEALQALKVKSVTIDGEGVVCGPDVVPDFDLLRAGVRRKGFRDALLQAFDVLELDELDLGRDLFWDEHRQVRPNWKERPAMPTTLRYEYLHAISGMQGIDRPAIQISAGRVAVDLHEALSAVVARLA